MNGILSGLIVLAIMGAILAVFIILALHTLKSSGVHPNNYNETDALKIIHQTLQDKIQISDAEILTILKTRNDYINNPPFFKRVRVRVENPADITKMLNQKGINVSNDVTASILDAEFKYLESISKTKS